MSKNHDFGSTEPVPDDVPVVVQYRNFGKSLISNFELFAAGKPDQDTVDGFYRFARGQAKAYKRFVTKWVLTDRPNITVVKYEKLTRNPVKAMKPVIELYDPSISNAEIEKAVASIDHITHKGGQAQISGGVGVVDLREIKSFRFYDETKFRRVRQMSKAARQED